MFILPYSVCGRAGRLRKREGGKGRGRGEAICLWVVVGTHRRPASIHPFIFSYQKQSPTSPLFHSVAHNPPPSLHHSQDSPPIRSSSPVSVMAMVSPFLGSSGLVAPLKPSLGFGIRGISCTPRFPSKFKVCSFADPKVSPPVSQDMISMGLAGAVFAAMASADSAFAAQQIMELAAEDNRGAAILIPLVPALGWVLFNIFQPALNQLEKMRSAKGLALGLGLSSAAALMLALRASAIEEIASIAADNDSRGLLLLVVLVPAIGWVLFNILRPALNQLDRMRSSKAIVGGLGVGAALSACCFPGKSHAVDDIAAIAASPDNDSRGLLLLIVVLPAIGWVLFNILRPALNQLEKMRNK